MSSAAAPAEPSHRAFLGWRMAGIAFLLYGFGMAPAYYGWGLLAPEVIEELGLSRRDVGDVFGLFTLTFSLASPAAAAAISRFGVRPVIGAGTVIGAFGFAATSVADSLRELLVAYALAGGIGIGLTTLLPAQLLPAHWFVRYRARATALILSGAAVVGAFWPAVALAIVETADWRLAWRVVAGITLVVGTIAVVFLRDRPSDVGQHPDGDARAPAPPCADDASDGERSGLDAGAVLRSPRFALVTFACLANAVPWRVVTAHGRIHLEDLEFASGVAAAILGFRVGMSLAGRLSGSVGDLLDPRRVLALALVCSAIGLVTFATASTEFVAYLSIGLLGFGYGVGFTSEPVVLAHVFGANAFVMTNGVRLGITGLVGWLGPRWTGAAADATGSYAGAFTVLAGLSVAGAIVVSLTRTERHPKIDDGR